jgi:hypothetical protein
MPATACLKSANLLPRCWVILYEGFCDRLAQGVRSREEPEETFLKGVPANADRLEIIYPVSSSDSFVSVGEVCLRMQGIFMITIISHSSVGRLTAGEVYDSNAHE